MSVPLSEQLREVIRASGIRQQELADALGVHKSMVSRFLSGQRYLAMPTLDRLAILLGIELRARQGTSAPRPLPRTRARST